MIEILPAGYKAASTPLRGLPPGAVCTLVSDVTALVGFALLVAVIENLVPIDAPGLVALPIFIGVSEGASSLYFLAFDAAAWLVAVAHHTERAHRALATGAGDKRHFRIDALDSVAALTGVHRDILSKEVGDPFPGPRLI